MRYSQGVLLTTAFVSPAVAAHPEWDYLITSFENHLEARQTSYIPSSYYSYVGTVIVTVVTYVPCPTSYSTTTITKRSTCSCIQCTPYVANSNCCESPQPCVECDTYVENSNCCPPTPCVECDTYVANSNCCESPPPCVECTPYQPNSDCCEPTPTPIPCVSCTPYVANSDCCEPPPTTCVSCTPYVANSDCCDPTEEGEYAVTTYTTNGFVVVGVTEAAPAASAGALLVSAARAEISTLWLIAWIAGSLAVGVLAMVL